MLVMLRENQSEMGIIEKNDLSTNRHGVVQSSKFGYVCAKNKYKISLPAVHRPAYSSGCTCVKLHVFLLVKNYFITCTLVTNFTGGILCTGFRFMYINKYI